MIVLSFDTTSVHGGAALFRDRQSMGELRAVGSANYSVELFEMVNRLLAAADLRLRDVDLFAVATGPGSFTGIRVGLAAAQGWARSLDRPVRGVSVFEAMIEEAHPGSGVAVPLLDARRGEFYCGIFRGDEESGSKDAGGDDTAATAAMGWTQLGDGLVLDTARIVTFAGELSSQRAGGLAFVAREDDITARSLAGRLGNELQRPAHPIMVPSFLAAAIARVALRAASQGRLQRPEELDAFYIRRSDAELNWRE